MSDRRKKLSDMLNATTHTFKTAIVESKDFVKLTRHSGMKVEKQEIDVLMARMAEKFANNVREATNQLIKENEICERFDELDTLTKQSERENEQLGRATGYQHINPKRDIGLHLSESTNASLAAASAEIEKLERELAEADEELNKKKAVFGELVSVVESQQNKLWA